MITADQIIAHAVGDYVLQSTWQATQKTSKNLPALVHASIYTLCFIPFVLGLTLFQAVVALAVIGGSHFVIDRWRLARYVVWLKEFLAPRATCHCGALISQCGGHSTPETTWWHPWSECSGTGYHKDRPAFMSVWLLIFADNIIHIIINGATLYFIDKL